ncbi:MULTISPECIES: colicin E3-like toxin immunity protein [Providencia]|uniref:Microcin-E3 immunity protein n=1 Tax=Providencia rettgeri TaxID=587 RepID=A0A379FUU3_PRORE|nr:MULTISPECIES: colicin E3-like toxin immunity protein [Providencia]EJF7710261.1 cloacin [Providencia rettgeri]EMB5786486.1 cloacin [Providencia rettgeri]MBS0915242.1 cloacin [Providencia rettgeri]MCX9109928.1 cloacin immunity family protein [Providencia rettgeri]MCX9118531.1 cloacin immunity family protein [Providencia rettgeri]
MGLKLHTQWFDKQTGEFMGEEYSEDFGDDDFLIDKTIDPKDENIINNGVFDLQKEWVIEIQSHVIHQIDLDKFVYQVSFDYRDEW